MELQKKILAQIEDKKQYQKDIAQTYARIIVFSKFMDVKIVNRAIVKRWSKSGLNRVKQMAWDMLRDVGVKL